MKNKILYSVAIAFMASGMALAQSSGQGTTDQDSMDSQATASAQQMSGQTDQPADVAKEDETQNDQTMQPDKNEHPGAMAAPAETEKAPDEAQMNTPTEAEIDARQNETMKENDENNCDALPANDPSCAH